MDVFNLTVKQLATKIKEAQLTSVDLCKAYIKRINEFEKDIHAWAHFDKKVLLEKAEESDINKLSLNLCLFICFSRFLAS